MNVEPQELKLRAHRDALELALAAFLKERDPFHKVFFDAEADQQARILRELLFIPSNVTELAAANFGYTIDVNGIYQDALGRAALRPDTDNIENCRTAIALAQRALRNDEAAAIKLTNGSDDIPGLVVALAELPSQMLEYVAEGLAQEGVDEGVDVAATLKRAIADIDEKLWSVEDDDEQPNP